MFRWTEQNSSSVTVVETGNLLLKTVTYPAFCTCSRIADTLRNEYLNGKSELQSSSAMASGGIAMEPSARTLPSVLRRLRSIIAGSSQVGFLVFKII